MIKTLTLVFISAFIFSCSSERQEREQTFSRKNSNAVVIKDPNNGESEKETRLPDPVNRPLKKICEQQPGDWDFNTNDNSCIKFDGELTGEDICATIKSESSYNLQQNQ